MANVYELTVKLNQINVKFHFAKYIEKTENFSSMYFYNPNETTVDDELTENLACTNYEAKDVFMTTFTFCWHGLRGNGYSKEESMNGFNCDIALRI